MGRWRHDKYTDMYKRDSRYRHVSRDRSHAIGSRSASYENSSGSVDGSSRKRMESRDYRGTKNFKSPERRMETQDSSNNRRHQNYSKPSIESRGVESPGRRGRFRFDSPPRQDDKPSTSADSIAMSIARGQASINQMAASMGLDAETAKGAREIYVGNIPPGVDVPTLVNYLNHAATVLGASILPGPCVLRAWIASEGHYAFVEFRTMEEASNCMLLSGINFMGHNLRIGRPRTFPPELVCIAPRPTIGSIDPAILAKGVEDIEESEIAKLNKELNKSMSGDAGTSLPDSVDTIDKIEKLLDIPERLYVIGIPSSMDYDGFIEKFKFFGPTRYCYEMKDCDGNSLNVLVLEYDSMIGQQHCFALNKNNSVYKIVTASEAYTSSDFPQKAMEHLCSGADFLKIQPPTNVILLLKIINRDDLHDDAEYVDICEDVKIEAETYGSVKRVVVPRPSSEEDETWLQSGRSLRDLDEKNYVGSAFIVYESAADAISARKGFDGRQFGGNTVLANYSDSQKFDDDFSNDIISVI